MPESTHAHAPPHGWWFVRPLAALLLLLGEYLAVSFFFDAWVLFERADDFAAVGLVGMLGPIVVAFATALWLLGGRELSGVVRRSVQVEDAPWFPLLLLHLMCFAAFFGASAQVFGVTAPGAGLGLWVPLWVLLGAATFLSWLPVAIGRLHLGRLFRQLALPLTLAALLGLLAWGAGIVTLELWGPLSGATLNAVVSLLELFVAPVVYDPSDATVGTEGFWVIVAPVCSGYEGIGLVLAFLTAYLVVFRDRFRFPHVLLLIPIALVAVWSLNVVRIVSLILVGHYWSPELAIGSFHSKAGWVFFCAVALGTVWTSERVKWFARDPHAPRKQTRNPSGPFLLPLLAVVATALVTGLATEGFDYLYPVRIGVAITVLAWFRRDYVEGLRAQLDGRSFWSWQAVGIGVLVYVVWVALWSLGHSGADATPLALSEMSAHAAFIWILARVFGSIVIIPIVEELAFRGFLLRRLSAKDFTKVPYDAARWPEVLVSSLAFAVLHQQWIAGFCAGVGFALALRRRGALSDAVLAHMTTNALIGAQVLIRGDWSLW